MAKVKAQELQVLGLYIYIFKKKPIFLKFFFKKAYIWTCNLDKLKQLRGKLRSFFVNREWSLSENNIKILDSHSESSYELSYISFIILILNKDPSKG